MKRTFSALGIVIVLALLAVLAGPAFAAANFVIPTISIVSVDPGKTVTIQTYNYPANDTFDVLMNTYGTLGIGGIKVTSISSSTGGSQIYTFTIPDSLKSLNLIAIRLQSPTSGLFSYNWFVNQTAGVPITGGQVAPTFTINSVVADKTVTITTSNLPANDTFDVLMNTIGTLGIGGTKVDSVASGTGGTLSFTFNIPDALKGQQQIAIRLQSPTSGFFAYNWFWNNTAGIPNTGGLPVGVIPTISIVSVDPGKTVTIQTNNFPASDNFDVYMNNYGTLGIGGTKVTSVSSGTGGTMSFTFNIPDAYKNLQSVAIRLQSPTSGYFSYNWFWNVTAGVPNTGGVVPLGVVPTISIQSVVKDGTVTVVTANYPANDTFDVYMNFFGTAGLNGIKIGSVNTGSGGVLTFTFNIPDALKGQSQIAIRLQSPTSGYFSYNWFWNVTYP